MSTGNVQLEEDIKKLREEEDKSTIDVPFLQGLNVEYAVANKWYAYVPLANVLGTAYSNLELNIFRFAIPQMIMGSTSTTFKGYTYEFPTHVIDADTKEITLEYIIDAKWQNYRSLFKWCCATEGQINQIISTSDVEKISNSDFIDCRIYLLDHFKNRIISFLFENCWIKNFSDLALEASSTEPVKHSITMAYSNFKLEDC